MSISLNFWPINSRRSPLWFAIFFTLVFWLFVNRHSGVGRILYSAPYFCASWIFGFYLKLYRKECPQAAEILLRWAHRGTLASLIFAVIYLTYVGLEISWLFVPILVFVSFCVNLIYLRITTARAIPALKFAWGGLFISLPICIGAMLYFATDGFRYFG